MEQSREPKEPDVQVMSPAERDSFQGLTINENDKQQESAGFNTGASSGGIYIRHVNWTATGWLTKMLIGLVLLALVFGAAAFGGLLLVLAAFGWLIRRLFWR